MHLLSVCLSFLMPSPRFKMRPYACLKATLAIESRRLANITPPVALEWKCYPRIINDGVPRRQSESFDQPKSFHSSQMVIEEFF